MGKFIPARDFVFGTEKQIRDLLSEYNDAIHIFEQKNYKKYGVKARKILLQLKKLIVIRRKEINERHKKIKYNTHKEGEFC
jgi:hypothetical protein